MDDRLHEIGIARGWLAAHTRLASSMLSAVRCGRSAPILPLTARPRQSFLLILCCVSRNAAPAAGHVQLVG
jgi:hypothetical protein